MLEGMEVKINQITGENLELERKIEAGREAKKDLFKNREKLKDLMQDYFSEIKGNEND